MAGPLVPTRGFLRVLRGCLLAAMSTTLAVLAHVVGGGAAPNTGLTVLLTVGVAGAGVALADRRRGAVSILAGLGVSHLVVHLILTVAERDGGMADMPGPAVISGWPMVGAHVAAVLIAAAILARAESAIFAAWSALAMLLPRRLTVPPVPEARPGGLVIRPRPAGKPREVLLRRVCARRGPPLPA